MSSMVLYHIYCYCGDCQCCQITQRQGSWNLNHPLLLSQPAKVPSDPLASIHHALLIPGGILWWSVEFTVLSYPLALDLCTSSVTNFLCFPATFQRPKETGHELGDEMQIKGRRNKASWSTAPCEPWAGLIISIETFTLDSILTVTNFKIIFFPFKLHGPTALDGSFLGWSRCREDSLKPATCC